MGMTEVTLSGQLICADQDEAARVRAALDAHITATRAEVGCIAFSVAPTPDPLIWQVDERFTDPSAFEAHQTRASTSEWALQTKGIKRAYTIQGMP
jgi:quinol monooxygenase YgiN